MSNYYTPHRGGFMGKCIVNLKVPLFTKNSNNIPMQKEEIKETLIFFKELQREFPNLEIHFEVQV